MKQHSQYKRDFEATIWLGVRPHAYTKNILKPWKDGMRWEASFVKISLKHHVNVYDIYQSWRCADVSLGICLVEIRGCQSDLNCLWVNNSDALTWNRQIFWQLLSQLLLAIWMPCELWWYWFDLSENKSMRTYQHRAWCSGIPRQSWSLATEK